ncbi:hypothetical protein FRB96_005425 [Tulasnella sp. 330]|nr:hypothetical protein FRB96_005425 [Tulasnella sp. 330]
MSDVEYKPATGIYLFRNAATKTMVDLINGGDYNPMNIVQGYEKVESESFRNQYWYTTNIGNPDLPNAYYIVNIRTNKFLTIAEGAKDVTAVGQFSDPEERKTQEWLFWKGKSGLCRIQNLARREENVARGFLKLAKNSASNYVQVQVDLKDDDLTQQWRIINRSRTSEEIVKLAGESAPSLLGGVTALLPPRLLVFEPMPNIMYQIIQGKYTDKGDIIRQGKAHFDKTQIFAFKHCVDRWANENLSLVANTFHVITGLTFGQQSGAAKTAVWGLRDDDLDSVMYFDLQKGQIQNSDPTFTPSDSFF